MIENKQETPKEEETRIWACLVEDCI